MHKPYASAYPHHMSRSPSIGTETSSCGMPVVGTQHGRLLASLKGYSQGRSMDEQEECKSVETASICISE